MNVEIFAYGLWGNTMGTRMTPIELMERACLPTKAGICSREAFGVNIFIYSPFTNH